jgi:hypothetical protein
MAGKAMSNNIFVPASLEGRGYSTCLAFEDGTVSVSRGYTSNGPERGNEIISMRLKFGDCSMDFPTYFFGAEVIQAWRGIAPEQRTGFAVGTILRHLDGEKLLQILSLVWKSGVKEGRNSMRADLRGLLTEEY